MVGGENGEQLRLFPTAVPMQNRQMMPFAKAHFVKCLGQIVQLSDGHITMNFTNIQKRVVDITFDACFGDRPQRFCRFVQVDLTMPV